MRTIQAAIRRAQAAARKARDVRFVVDDSGPEYRDDRYHVADEFDLEGFFLGCPVLAEVGPDGVVEDSIPLT